MGTGVVSVLLHQIPYESPVLYYASIVFFILNTILFTIALTISILRYTLYPAIWGVMVRDPANSLFLGTIPMGFATLILCWINICVPLWGDWAKTVAFVAWIVDAVVSVIATLGLPMMLMSHDDIHSLDRINAAQLLPIAATVVASGIGAKVASIMIDEQVVLGTVITCYILWGLSIPFAFMIFVIYYHRLALHKLPPREVIVSAFLPLGPCGYSANILMMLGQVCRVTLPKTQTLNNSLAGEVAHAGGFFVGLIIWSFGLLWFFFALAAIYRSRPIPFNMGWWGFTFPLGVYANCTLQIGQQLPSRFFRVLGTIFAIAVFLLWIVVAAGTVKGALSKKLFFAPCLANLKKEEESESDGSSKAA
ncbi:C4-dicarboxylate transporter/malic acid transport protein [Microthyrium microscopicum]|uniref:C4-dicarboxylate transporter/malic acid transport protein n=1 Tax=Microthyrium microscopicum TaxID=703497 RepID=A0A6A6UGU0_9PEZI|nr:C4-dicarboxylate transporter/malic acid transport protein [Microthyrium microscopicum]